MKPLRAPFPWFGGKSRVAHIVWPRFGDVPNFIEPFAGSLAVLLGRPHDSRVETVNDVDCYLANFWRALQHAPDEVAYWADAPVNETDLHARHRWLVKIAREQVDRCLTDPDYYSAQIAGWWVWGQCLWIGSGWCASPNTTDTLRAIRHQAGKRGITNWTEKVQRTAATFAGENPSEQRKRFRSDGSGGVHAQEHALKQKRPKLPERGYPGVGRRWQGGGQGGGSGVVAPRLHQTKPDMSGDAGATGRGVHRKLPSLSQGSNDRSGYGHGILGREVRTQGLYEYLAELAARLRRVRVCCGDWGRVLTPSVTTYIGTTAVFLDPPYSHDLRDRCYSEDHDISADVRAWALEHGTNPKFRIALCGYEGEHVMPATWECVPWKAHGGYSRTERGRANRSRERIWFSPSCLRPSDNLFSDEGLA